MRFRRVAAPNIKVNAEIRRWTDKNTDSVKTDWGRMTTKGDYFFRYRGINHTANRLSASAVTVKW